MRITALIALLIVNITTCFAVLPDSGYPGIPSIPDRVPLITEQEQAVFYPGVYTMIHNAQNDGLVEIIYFLPDGAGWEMTMRMVPEYDNDLVSNLHYYSYYQGTENHSWYSAMWSGTQLDRLTMSMLVNGVEYSSYRETFVWQGDRLSDWFSESWDGVTSWDTYYTRDYTWQGDHISEMIEQTWYDTPGGENSMRLTPILDGNLLTGFIKQIWDNDQ